jgi:hypothetical protein
MKRTVQFLLAYALDSLILLLLLLILFILTTGGGIYQVKADLLIRMHQITNPLVALYVFLVIRFLGAPNTPFLGTRALDVPGLSNRAAFFWDRLVDKLRAVKLGKARKIVLVIIRARVSATRTQDSISKR